MAILNKTITIDDIQTKFASTGNEGFTIISGKDKYTFYRTIKGQDGDVYKAFKAMDVKPHDTVNIGYTEEPSEFTNAKGELIKFTKRGIVSIREGDPSQTQLPVNKPLSVANNASQSQSKDDKFWERQAYEKCLSLWYTSTGFNHEDFLEGIKTGKFWELFQTIKADGELRFATGMEKARAIFKKDEEPLPEELPTIQSMECEVCGMEGRIKDDGHPCIPF